MVFLFFSFFSTPGVSKVFCCFLGIFKVFFPETFYKFSRAALTWGFLLMVLLVCF